MSAMLNTGFFSSEFDDYNTPEEVLERVRLVGPIGLDPCSNAQSIVRAATEWRLERGEDGLKRWWQGYGLAFVNPPYGRELYLWYRKIATEARRGVEIVVLVPHRTDNVAYQAYVRSANAKCEWEGRLDHPRAVADSLQVPLFGAAEPELVQPRETGVGAPFPSVVLYWGEQVDRFADAFQGAGLLWVPRRSGEL